MSERKFYLGGPEKVSISETYCLGLLGYHRAAWDVYFKKVKGSVAQVWFYWMCSCGME